MATTTPRRRRRLLNAVYLALGDEHFPPFIIDALVQCGGRLQFDDLPRLASVWIDRELAAAEAHLRAARLRRALEALGKLRDLIALLDAPSRS